MPSRSHLSPGMAKRLRRNMHHRFWANQLNSSMPNPPPGSLAGGPNTGLQDPVAQSRLTGCRPRSVTSMTSTHGPSTKSPSTGMLHLHGSQTGLRRKPVAELSRPIRRRRRPGTPTASSITASGAQLAWSASTDDRGVAGYDVLRIQGSTQSVLTTSAAPSSALSGLAANTDYTVAVRARDTAGQLSGISPSRTFRTLGGTTPDTPPSVPGTPTASAITASSAVLSWNASTDDRGVAGYDVLRIQGNTQSLLVTFDDAVGTLSRGSRPILTTSWRCGHVIQRASSRHFHHRGLFVRPAALRVARALSLTHLTAGVMDSRLA